jgi:hypothetical protein
VIPKDIRRRLAACFPGAFLLQKRCRCVLHVFGRGPKAEVRVEPCVRCSRYARIRARAGAVEEAA